MYKTSLAVIFSRALPLYRVVDSRSGLVVHYFTELSDDYIAPRYLCRGRALQVAIRFLTTHVWLDIAEGIS